MKTSKYQALLDRLPVSLHSLAEEAYCIGYQSRLQCERDIKDAGRDYSDEACDQNDYAVLQESLHGGWQTRKQAALLAYKYSPEGVELEVKREFSPQTWILAAKSLQKEHDEADKAFLTRLKDMREDK